MASQALIKQRWEEVETAWPLIGTEIPGGAWLAAGREKVGSQRGGGGVHSLTEYCPDYSERGG